MAGKLKHRKVSAVADGADSTKVRPQADWNDGLVASEGSNDQVAARASGETDGWKWINPDVWLKSGTLAARPAATAVLSGTYYFATDDNGGTLYRSDATTWTALAPAKSHKDTHKSGGSDALTSSDLLEALIKRIRESGGADLLVGAITDGQFLKRIGTSIISAAIGSGLTWRGGDTTERSTTSTSMTDLSSASLGTSIPAASPILAMWPMRRGFGTASALNVSFKLNGTAIISDAEVIADADPGSNKNFNIFVLVSPRVSNYLQSAMFVAVIPGGTIIVLQPTVDAPTAAITSVTIAARNAGSGGAITIATDEFHVYELATS